MEPYAVSFAALACFSIALAYHRHQIDKRASPKESLALPSCENLVAETKFKWEYSSLYALVMVSDWLQGPFMYTLYKDEKQMAEHTVAALFMTGFITAGITAFFVGSMADQYGRKAGCLAFCIAYGISCLSMLSNDAFSLFAGRALGGLSTTLLYFVFETWMIAEYHKRDLSGSLSLSSMFSSQIMLSSVVAIISGVVGEAVVRYTNAKASPFILSLACLVLAFCGIQKMWPENYGETMSEKDRDPGSLTALLSDRRILAITMATTRFEGSMYLFVFFWSSTLIAAHSSTGVDSPLPFGLIFSCFMCSVMLGSTIFGIVKADNARDAGHLLLSVLALGSLGLLIPVVYTSESATFWSFMLFELCVGMYFPSMSRLKSELIDDSVRAKVYGFLRLPLNVFIAVALSITQDGDEHRSRVFTATEGLLLFAFWVVRRHLL